MRVLIHEDVRAQLDLITGNDIRRKAIILSDLNDLALVPEPSNYDWRWTSLRVKFLWDSGYRIHRLNLKASLPKHRFFYHHDAAHEVVFVIELAKKGKGTYDPDAPHIERVKEKYDDYYRRRLWQP